jgi:hypothetical protein
MCCKDMAVLCISSGIASVLGGAVGARLAGLLGGPPAVYGLGRHINGGSDRSICQCRG